MMITKPLKLKTEEEKKIVAVILARFAFCLDPELDEFECEEIAREFLDKAELSAFTMNVLAPMFRSTKFNPKHNVWN